VQSSACSKRALETSRDGEEPSFGAERLQLSSHEFNDGERCAQATMLPARQQKTNKLSAVLLINMFLGWTSRCRPGIESLLNVRIIALFFRRIWLLVREGIRVLLVDGRGLGQLAVATYAEVAGPGRRGNGVCVDLADLFLRRRLAIGFEGREGAGCESVRRGFVDVVVVGNVRRRCGCGVSLWLVGCNFNGRVDDVWVSA